MSETNSTRLWDSVRIPADQTLLFQLGHLSVKIQPDEHELHMQISRDEAAPYEPDLRTEPGQEIPSTGVEDFACRVEDPVIQARPVMPDRSVVVRPKNRISVLPAEQALFFVSIPIWVQFELILSKPVVLKTMPVVTRSATWYGDPMSGEHCYVEKSSAARVLQADAGSYWQAVCPITVHNRDKNPIDVTRLCVQVSHLGVFQGSDRLWTQPVTIVNREGSDPMEATYGKGAPDWEPIERTLSEPRNPARKSLLSRGLSTLRLPGF